MKWYSQVGLRPKSEPYKLISPGVVKHQGLLELMLEAPSNGHYLAVILALSANSLKSFYAYRAPNGVQSGGALTLRVWFMYKIQALVASSILARDMVCAHKASSFTLAGNTEYPLLRRRGLAIADHGEKLEGCATLRLSTGGAHAT